MCFLISLSCTGFIRGVGGSDYRKQECATRAGVNILRPKFAVLKYSTVRTEPYVMYTRETGPQSNMFMLVCTAIVVEIYT